MTESSAERSVKIPRKIPCFPDCVILGKASLRVESVNGINKHIIRNFVKSSVFSRFCLISLITLTTALKLMEGYVWTIWNRLESITRLLKKIRGMLRGRFRVFQIVSYKVKRQSNVAQIDTD